MPAHRHHPLDELLCRPIRRLSFPTDINIKDSKTFQDMGYGGLFINPVPKDIQLPVSQFVKYGWKKSPGRLHTWKIDRKAGGGAYRHQCSCRVQNQQKSVVSRAWKAFQTTGTAVRKVGGGRPRTATAGDDRYIIMQAKRGRRQSASVIAQQLSTATGRQVSRFTVAKRLHKGGLLARRPERCHPLKVDHRRHRLQWCREHKNWTTVNGVVSSLRMRVGSVPEAILDAF
ncbi:transposable element Tcb2 transposase [Trichonephila clavipes]|nr:transposable element Tcb2 transposase [Trichonephila clavipes]